MKTRDRIAPDGGCRVIALDRHVRDYLVTAR